MSGRSVGASVEGDEKDAYLHLDYRLDGCPMRQRIKLEALPCRFGGVRWLAIFSNTGRRVAYLYIGGSGAYSRQAYGFNFDSQRECPLDRSLRRRQKTLAKLKTDDPWFLPRPKGMHARTYERRCVRGLGSRLDRAPSMAAIHPNADAAGAIFGDR